MHLTQPPMPVFDRSLETLTAPDLVLWEPVAVYDFVAMTLNKAQWVANAPVPTMTMVRMAMVRIGAGPRIRDLTDDREDEPERLTLDLVGHVLAFSSLKRLMDLRTLATWYGGGSEEANVSVQYVVERHRRGYRVRDMETLDALGLPVEFTDGWVNLFALEDLRLVLDAGFTAEELVGVVESGVLPDREALQVVAGLRGLSRPLSV